MRVELVVSVRRSETIRAQGRAGKSVPPLRQGRITGAESQLG
jgi:hypothetical protein